MNFSCSNQDACPVILDSKCVIYEGENLLYIGVNTNDNYRTALQNINDVIGNLILTGGITELTGDVIAVGPGIATATLATVNSTPGQYGSSTAIPKLTVDGKGRVTAITTEGVFIPSGALSFIGDVTGTGNTGSNTTLTLATVNSNVYTTNNFLKFAVNGKGLITSATPIVSSDIISALGYTPYNSTNPAGYISGITGSMVINALGYTPYNSTNPAGYISTINGIVAGGELSGTYPNPTLNNAAVTGKVLTGVNITGGTVVSTDTILTAFGKLQNQINSLIGGSIYQGVWNAATNVPFLQSGVGTKGHYYITDVYGTTNLDGIAEWHVGDWAIFDGTEWQKVDNTDAVISVNGFTGAVSLTTDNIPEGLTNQYFTTSRARLALSGGTGISYDNVTGVISSTITQYTDALARQAISLTTTGTSGPATYNSTTGVLNIPNYTTDVSGYVPYTGATTNVNLGVYGLTAGSAIFGGIVTINATGNQARALYMQTGTDGSHYVSQTGVNLFSEATDNLTMLFTTASTTKKVILNGADITSAKTYTLPNASGTLALTSDIPSLTNYVTLNTTQTITGQKTFNATLYGVNSEFSSSILSPIVAVLDSSTYTKVVRLQTLAATNRDVYFPDLNGTVVLLEGSQTFTGNKTFSGGAIFTLAGGVVGFSGGIAVDRGNAITKGSTPASFSPASTTLYSDLGDNNLVLRDSTNTSILQFQASSSYTYTFPSINGTLALLEGTQTITGAKTFANNVRIDNGSASAFLGFKQYPSGSTGIAGFTSIYAISTDTLGISFGAANDILFKTASPTFPRTYTFPNNSGTVALTSDIPSLSGYVPTSRVLTINGVSYNLTADASWTVSAGTTLNGTGFVKASGTTITYDNSTYYLASNPNGYITSSGSISGNAATATNSSQLNGISSTQIFNNMGQNHSTQTNFDSISDFGFRYVQGTTNGPGTGSSQFYGMSLGLGNDYTYSAYALQLAIPRFYSSDKYISFRAREGGSWGSWVKVSAGYADSAGTAGNTSSISSAVGGSYTWTGIQQFQTNNGGQAVNNSNTPSLQAFSTGNNSAFMAFHKGGHYAVNFGLDNDNVLRIGGWSAGANRLQLDMSGNLTMAGDVTAYSDARVKENVETIKNALNKVLALRGVSYNRTDSDDKKTKIGVIAQETLPIVPEVVNQDNDGMYNVSYGNFGGLFIEAFKEQQKQIKEQAEEIKELKSIINGFTK